MIKIIIGLFAAFLGASFLYQQHRGSAVKASEAPSVAIVAASNPGPTVAPYHIRQIKPPELRTSLLPDTELEERLLESLLGDKAIHDAAQIHSVNCEDSRCQALVEPRPQSPAPQAALLAHLESHPEFGRSLLISPNPDKENKKLLTFTYSRETQVSTTH